MPEKACLIIISTVILLLMLFGNKKVRLLSVIERQIQVFKNAKKNKISIWDLFCFIIFPIILAYILVYRFEFVIIKELAGVLTTVFAFVFTVLFGFAAILVGKIDSSNKIEKQVVGETFVSILSSNLLSLMASIMSIVVYMSININIIKILSTVIYSLSFMIIMLILMISKRTFIIYCNNFDDYGNRK